MNYTYLIDEKKLHSLSVILNSKIIEIYGIGFHVYKDYIETQSLSLKVAHDLWLNFSNEARETPNNNDYYKFVINSDNAPNGIAYNNNSLIYPFSKVSFDPFIIKSIEVYQRNEIYDEEELNYDVLILFNGKSKKRFMIALEERIDEFIIYSSNSKIISKYLNGLECRKKLTRCA